MNINIIKNNNLYYGIFIIIFLYIYSPTLGDAYKGEMWELLYSINNNQNIFDQINAISNFVCFNAARFQPLAFFIPYYLSKLDNTSFIPLHLVGLFLHILLAFIAAIWVRSEKNSKLSIFIFGIVLFNLTSSDVIIWNFFTYIQVQTILLLISAAFFIGFIKLKRVNYLYASWIAGIICCLIYESGLSIFISQVVFLLIFRKSLNTIIKKHILIAYLVCIISLFFIIAYSKMGLEFKDSNQSFNIMIIPKIFIFILYYIRYNFGINSEIDIYNIANLNGLNFDLSIWNIIGIIIIFTNIYMFYHYGLKNILKCYVDKKYELSYLLLLSIIYIFIIAYGRVAADSELLNASGLESQPRYFYFIGVTFPIVFFLLINNDCFYKNKNCLLFLFFFITIGNISNIYNFSKNINLATYPLTLHALGMVNSKNEILSNIINDFHNDWYLGNIKSSDEKIAYTHNANRCHSHPELINNKKELISDIESKYISRESKSINSNSTYINPLLITVNSSSNLKGASPNEALLGHGMWHVKHTPYPPAKVIMDFSFKDGISRKIVGLGFLPRQDHSSHFWKRADLFGRNGNEEWIKIIEIKLINEPDDEWIFINFENNKKYNQYKFIINSGFSDGRFISLAGIKIFEGND